MAQKTEACNICDIKVSGYDLDAHVKRIHLGIQDKSEKCAICEMFFYHKKALAQHVKTVHQYSEPKNCPQCDYSTTSTGSLTMHKKRAHTRNEMKCNVCGSCFPSNRALVRHQFNGHGIKARFACESCHFVAYEKRDLQVHMNRKHLHVKPFACDVCDFKSTTQGTVNKHKRQVHLKLKPFPCPECDYRAFTRTMLKSHTEAKHKREPPKQKKKLEEGHQKKPTSPDSLKKKKVQKCDVCDLGFANEQTLENHQRVIHLNLKPFQCDKCDYRCGVKCELNRHVRAKHGVAKKRMFCDVCDKEFGNGAALKFHTKQVHSDNPAISKCEFCDYRLKHSSYSNNRMAIESHILKMHKDKL